MFTKVAAPTKTGRLGASTYVNGNVVLFFGGVVGTATQQGQPTPALNIAGFNLDDLTLNETGFSIPGQMPLQHAALAALVPNDGGAGFVYLVGGQLGPNATAQVLVAALATDGGIASIAVADGGTLSTARQGAVAVVLDGGLYVFGGFGVDGGLVDTAEVATFNDDGSTTAFGAGGTVAMPIGFGVLAFAGPNPFLVGGVGQDAGALEVSGAVSRLVDPTIPAFDVINTTSSVAVALPAVTSTSMGVFTVAGGFSSPPPPALIGQPIAVRDVQSLNVSQNPSCTDNPIGLNVARGDATAVCARGGTLMVIGGATNLDGGGLVTEDSVEILDGGCPHP